MEKHLATKLALAEKNQQKEAKWERRRASEERNIALEEQKRKDNKIAEEDRFLMMDLSGMEPMATKFYELKRMDIMVHRRQELHDLIASGGGASANVVLPAMVMMAADRKSVV